MSASISLSIADSPSPGNDERGRRRGRDHVEARRVHALLDDRPSVRAQVVRKPASGGAFASRRGIDVDERARQRDDVDRIGYRIHASSSVRVSVRESRYFTMTGVASESLQSTPLPEVTARAPGTTTAPSGITRGRSADGLRIS